MVVRQNWLIYCRTPSCHLFCFFLATDALDLILLKAIKCYYDNLLSAASCDYFLLIFSCSGSSSMTTGLLQPCKAASKVSVLA